MTDCPAGKPKDARSWEFEGNLAFPQSQLSGFTRMVVLPRCFGQPDRYDRYVLKIFLSRVNDP